MTAETGARSAPGVARVTATECAVLGMLADGEQSGYDLLKRIERSVGLFWQTARSQLYNVLPKLVDRGLATARHVEQETRPDKLMYRITEAGRQALREGLEQPFSGVDKNVVLLKTYLGGYMRREKIVEFLEGKRQRAEGYLEWLEEVECQIDRDELFFPYLTVLHGLEHTRAELRWCAHALKLIEERGDR